MLQRVKARRQHAQKLHPHICRHTFSVRYLVNGGDVFSLQKILGHTSLDMTRKYVNLASGDVKRNAPPLQPDGQPGFSRQAARPAEFDALEDRHHKVILFYSTYARMIIEKVGENGYAHFK